MKILVTGNKGFIGKNIALYLQSQGHEVEGWDWQPGIVPSTEGFDWCIHTGAISSTTYTDVEQILQQNFEFSVMLTSVCQNFGTNLQYASSASVYGPTTHFTESGPLLPQSPYAWSKYLYDRFVDQHLDSFDITIQGFRYFNVYGQYGEEHKGNMASPYTKFTQQAKDTGVVTLFENSENFKRDFVSVEDICALQEKMFDVEESGVWNVGTGVATSFDTVGRTIAKKYGADIKYIPMPDALKGQYQEYTCANLDKLNSTVDIEWTNIEDYINAAK
jgi:ADP-L-glycero-D-manno-heptose 6-epimerase